LHPSGSAWFANPINTIAKLDASRRSAGIGARLSTQEIASMLIRYRLGVWRRGHGWRNPEGIRTSADPIS
jgi:hypothetical protein